MPSGRGAGIKISQNVTKQNIKKNKNKKQQRKHTHRIAKPTKYAE